MNAIPLSALLLLSGCFQDKGSGLADNGPHCEDTPSVITLEEATDLGFSGAELLALAEGEHAETLTWLASDTTTGLTVTVHYDAGEVRFVDSEAVYPDTGMSEAIGVECDDRVEVDVTVAVVTEDGALNESFGLALSSTDGASASARVSFDHTELNGSYTFDLMDPSEYDSVEHSLDMSFDAEGSGGELTAQAEGCDDCPDDQECTCWASMDTIATWPSEDLE